MTDSTEPKPAAWQPFTPRGVAALAQASLSRLLLVQFIFALVAATALVWFLRTAWFPTVRAAIAQLPAQGAMKSGKLNWSGNSPQSLAEGHFLAFVVDTNHSGTLCSPAQIQVEFGRDDVFFRSLAGYREWPYPSDWNFGFNRVELQPWWGAWSPPILWIAFGAMLAWCMASWTLLATIYFLPVWLGAFFTNRDLNLRQSWKLAGAALMPGAVVMILAILAYGFGVLDLVGLAAAVGAHLIVGWIYIIWSAWVCPRLSSTAVVSENPFAGKAANDNLKAPAGNPE
jgi:hypothetical protein